MPCFGTLLLDFWNQRFTSKDISGRQLQCEEVVHVTVQGAGKEVVAVAQSRLSEPKGLKRCPWQGQWQPSAGVRVKCE